jgi:hypothetical protein
MKIYDIDKLNSFCRSTNIVRLWVEINSGRFFVYEENCGPCSFPGEVWKIFTYNYKLEGLNG